MFGEAGQSGIDANIAGRRWDVGEETRRRGCARHALGPVVVVQELEETAVRLPEPAITPQLG